MKLYEFLTDNEQIYVLKHNIGCFNYISNVNCNTFVTSCFLRLTNSKSDIYM